MSGVFDEDHAIGADALLAVTDQCHIAALPAAISIVNDDKVIATARIFFETQLCHLFKVFDDTID